MTPEQLQEIRNCLPAKDLLWNGAIKEPQASIAKILWQLVDEVVRLNELLNPKTSENQEPLQNDEDGS